MNKKLIKKQFSSDNLEINPKRNKLLRKFTQESLDVIAEKVETQYSPIRVQETLDDDDNDENNEVPINHTPSLVTSPSPEVLSFAIKN